jgi:hypothetical protein
MCVGSYTHTTTAPSREREGGFSVPGLQISMTLLQGPLYLWHHMRLHDRVYVCVCIVCMCGGLQVCHKTSNRKKTYFISLRRDTSRNRDRDRRC